MKYAVIPHDIEEFSEPFAKLPISSQIDFHSRYDQKMLHKESQDYIASQTTQGMYQPTIQEQGATNSVSAFVTVSRKIQNAHLVSIGELFLENIIVTGSKSRYAAEQVGGLPGG
jgi:hypothetical protein